MRLDKLDKKGKMASAASKPAGARMETRRCWEARGGKMWVVRLS